jgi:hypothetical protein
MIVRVLLKLNEDFILNDLLRNDFSQKKPYSSNNGKNL